MKRVSRITGVLVVALTLVVLAVGASPAFAHTQSLTIDPRGTLESGGLAARVSGTVVCTAGEMASISVVLSQFRHGQVVTTGSGGTPQFLCSGITQHWEITVSTFGAPFRNGTASARADSNTFGPDGFEQKTEFGQVRLR